MGMLNHGSFGVASCEIAEVTGIRALGRHALRFRLKMSVFDFRKHHERRGFLVWFGGELGTPVGLVPLHPVLDQVGLQEQDRELFIDAYLDHEQMRLLDHVRSHHNDLLLTLELRALISVEGTGVEPTHVTLRSHLNDSHWIRILADSGFDERQAIDVLLRYPGQPEALQKAAHEAQLAKACDRKGDWPGTFNHCRRAFEHVCDPGKVLASDRDRILSDRFKNAYAAIRDTLHAGPHVGIGDPGPDDARRVLGWTLLMLDDLNRSARSGGR